ncbi:MAG: outer membrane protein assembly factor BamD [Candidatus Omnitrophica bacterium]|jgi:outer membrane protein assembly factor BamD|nr:outer membrane protein assembly factor BamD [Candidatus Omnitrophota bacterium]MDD5079436.1 outer membrane protein assembly factor BamD [Candidatus Omnitrophota bacterium]
MKRIFLVFIVIFLGLGVESAYPYWIWTPKTGKWTNPKTSVKATPKGQFDLAKSFYEAKNHEQAKREFRKLMKNYPKSAEAAESQYYLGLIDESQGNLYAAFKSYQKVIDKYPFSERIAEINEREFKIGEIFMAGGKAAKKGAGFLVENPAVEIFTKVVENAPYGPLASQAEYKLGMVLKGLLRLDEAEEAFNKVVTIYPESEWASAAKFQIASSRASLSKTAEYDQGATQEAKQKFEEFVQEHPDIALSREAQKNIQQLSEKESESNFKIAGFYEKQKAFTAAKIYYEEIINKNPTSAWAAKALERIEIMESKK